LGEQAHYQAFRDMFEAYTAAYSGGDHEAIAIMIDFYAGAGHLCVLAAARA
jgi:hypothetical protein